jgi:hypothetical protein
MGLPHEELPGSLIGAAIACGASQHCWSRSMRTPNSPTKTSWLHAFLRDPIFCQAPDGGSAKSLSCAVVAPASQGGSGVADEDHPATATATPRSTTTTSCGYRGITAPHTPVAALLQHHGYAQRISFPVFVQPAPIGAKPHKHLQGSPEVQVAGRDWQERIG